MSYANHLVETYRDRTGQPRDSALDGAWQYQWTVLRDMLSCLEVILDDEGVPRETAVRVLRCLLYGSPSVADAELRMGQEQRMMELLARVPPQPVVWPSP